MELTEGTVDELEHSSSGVNFGILWPRVVDMMQCRDCKLNVVV